MKNSRNRKEEKGAKGIIKIKLACEQTMKQNLQMDILDHQNIS